MVFRSFLPVLCLLGACSTPQGRIESPHLSDWAPHVNGLECRLRVLAEGADRLYVSLEARNAAPGWLRVPYRSIFIHFQGVQVLDPEGNRMDVAITLREPAPMRTWGLLEEFLILAPGDTGILFCVDIEWKPPRPTVVQLVGNFTSMQVSEREVVMPQHSDGWDAWLGKLEVRTQFDFVVGRLLSE